VLALMEQDITPIAVHSSMRNVNIQFVVDDNEYQTSICALHDVFFSQQNQVHSVAV